MELDVREIDFPENGVDRAAELRLIQRAQRGNAEAYRELVDAYKERLFAFIWRTIRNHHEAEDICQAAFVKAYESLSSYSKQYAFSTWLFTIAYRLAMNHLRRKKAVGGEFDFAALDSEAVEVPETVANTEDARRMRDLIWSAVEQLPPAQRSAVLMFYREGKSCQEIGDMLGAPAVTVKSHLHRAREKLRTWLRSAYEGDWSVFRKSGSA